jgi:hypothetical protein
MEMPHAETLAPGVLEGDEEALARGECKAVDGREITVAGLDDLRELKYLWTSRLTIPGAEAVGQLMQLVDAPPDERTTTASAPSA